MGERLASHGIVAIFPFIKSQSQDDQVNPAVDDTSGKNLEAALDLIRNGSLAAMKIKIDPASIAIAGHNMGAVSAIRVAAKQAKGTAKVVIAMHPFPCDLGPPPFPWTVSSTEIQQANANSDLIYTTSEDDNAFGPWTPWREKKCFGNAVGNAIFVNFKGSACDAYPDCKDIAVNSQWGSVDCKVKFPPFGKGHFCPTSAPGVPKWVSPEAQWLITAVRLYLHHGMHVGSACQTLLWKSSAASLSNDPNVADKILQQKSKSAMNILV